MTSKTIRLTHVAFAAALLVNVTAARAGCSAVAGDGSITAGTAGSPTNVTCSEQVTSGAGQGYGPVVKGKPTADYVNLTVQSMTQWQTNNVSAISLHNNSNITVGSGTTPGQTQTTLVQTTANSDANSHYTNPSDSSKKGGYNTIEVDSGSTVTIGSNATVQASGSSGKNEAINVFGDGNSIVNYGKIIADTGAGEGTWTLTGAVGNNTASGSSPLQVYILDGTLALEGDNTGFNGSVVVNPLAEGSLAPEPNPDATLEARAQSLPPSVINHGQVVFNQVPAPGGGSADGTYAGTIQGEGSVRKDGPGTTVLTGRSSYTGGTTISAGTLQLGAGGNTGSIGPGAVTDNGTLAFNRSDVLPFANMVSGTGSLAQLGTGTVVLTADNSYSGGTSIAAGSTLQAGDGGSSGSIGSGHVDNDGTLVFDRSDVVSVGNTITGSGAVVQQGAGTTILTANNNWSGGTTISHGSLQLGNGGTTGSLTGDVADSGTLAFNRSDKLTYDGAVSGTGRLRNWAAGRPCLMPITRTPARPRSRPGRSPSATLPVLPRAFLAAATSRWRVARRLAGTALCRATSQTSARLPWPMRCLRCSRVRTAPSRCWVT
nr:autotransporter-associated beta strand repeat-containing protein [Burkholderia multivorans]